MMVLEGKKWEEIYEKTKQLPDPSKYESEDEIELMAMLKEIIPKQPTRFREMIKDIVGVSEETTTGVHRLY